MSKDWWFVGAEQRTALWWEVMTLEPGARQRAGLNPFLSGPAAGLPGNVRSFGLELPVQVLLSHLAWSYIQPQGSSGKSKLQLNPEWSCRSLSERGGRITQRRQMKWVRKTATVVLLKTLARPKRSGSLCLFI